MERRDSRRKKEWIRNEGKGEGWVYSIGKGEEEREKRRKDR